MKTTFTIRSTGGFENFLRLSATLKRRQIPVDSLSLINIGPEHFDMTVTLAGDERICHRVRALMEKNEDVYDVHENKN